MEDRIQDMPTAGEQSPIHRQITMKEKKDFELSSVLANEPIY